MIFSKSLLVNSVSGSMHPNAKKQWDEVLLARQKANQQELMFQANRQLAANQGIIPQDVYQEFDNVTVERMRSDDGDTYLNDLMALSVPINIGKLTHKFRRASDAGNAQTSMSGRIGVLMDQTEYSYDGSIIPIHDDGFFRDWREFEGMRSEGFDALIDDQRESVQSIREHLADNFLDGHRDKDGNLIVVDSLSWGGVKNDSRVAAIDLGAGGVNFDFTDQSQTYAAIEAAFKEVRDIMWITNNCSKELTIYISREMASNFERQSSESYGSEKIINRLAMLQGIAQIKTTNKMVGNEFMGFPLSRDVIRPMVGMGLNTVALPRPVYNSNHEFIVWGAIGYEVRNDYFNQKCVFYASA